jgi:hypothetical protein
MSISFFSPVAGLPSDGFNGARPHEAASHQVALESQPHSLPEF